MRINESYVSFHAQIWLYQVSEKEADDYSILMWPLHTASLNRWKGVVWEQYTYHPTVSSNIIQEIWKIFGSNKIRP